MTQLPCFRSPLGLIYLDLTQLPDKPFLFSFLLFLTHLHTNETITAMNLPKTKAIVLIVLNILDQKIQSMPFQWAAGSVREKITRRQETWL